jgi:hypothetical protein
MLAFELVVYVWLRWRVAKVQALEDGVPLYAAMLFGWAMANGLEAKKRYRQAWFWLGISGLVDMTVAVVLPNLG